MDRPGRLLAQGRDADILEAGEGRVVRRARDGRSLAAEAAIMGHARTKGYPVPEVYDVSSDGTEVTMERVVGPTMADVLASHPWRLGPYAGVLADLHRRLHEIEAPESARPAPGSEGARLVHFDLHPLNVLMSPTGPVVIDWANARRGNPAADVASTWLIIACAVPSGPLWTRPVIGAFRSRFVGRFLGGFDLEPVRAELAAVVEWKVADAHMSSAELDSMRRLAEREGG